MRTFGQDSRESRTPGAARTVSAVIKDMTATLHVATVLLVEDSPDDERLAVRTLRRLLPPVGVAVARDGQEALDALGLDGQEAPSVVPDLVLCDLKMPKLSGDEVLRRVRADARLGDVPFVVFTSSDEPTDVARCQALGATEYAVKPVDYEAYGERVAQIVGRHLPAYAS